MDNIIICPSKYVQGPNVMDNLGAYVKPLGSSVIVLADNFVTQLVEKRVSVSFSEQNIEGYFALFGGECSQPEIERLTAVAKDQRVEAVVGIGGGKTLDTAKAVGAELSIPVVIVPTIASTDAPTSALSVIYTPEGEFSEYRFYTKNPDVVIMDTQIVAQAPTRLLVSGMGDALSTYFEARANERSGKGTMAGGAPTKAAQALAKLCFQILMSDGLKAKVACDNNLSSRALENVVEANTYLSGIGFESSGLAAAHAIHNGLTLLEECHHLYHGEKVAFGTITQLVLENAPMEEINEVIEFCCNVGLPTNLTDMGVLHIDKDKLLNVAKAACAEGETIHNMPFKVTSELVLSAILTAHELGS
ncbi:glycerol 2-dehydrogenase (NAD+) [Vibrio diazotrophicus]|jgi:glycerol dehydrogenase|uniref:Glycerol dehydrogenase n=1 Tax=Vibrio diazotrophicus TaxID=685 RepID=A0A2J8GMM5_VIBDI|nr:glycerol dehydrogenase [Vibrio diazotrophicus]PNH87274.1 glycerol dehydrogenase [Vibrio diazotrophicus]RAS60559.1 glycerol 2-dehydrogenase (NAD+) [Vibrio diazotrophicus]